MNSTYTAVNGNHVGSLQLCVDATVITCLLLIIWANNNIIFFLYQIKKKICHVNRSTIYFYAVDTKKRGIVN